MGKLLTHVEFERVLDTSFQVAWAEGDIELLLTEVAVGKALEALPRTPFSLIFAGPGEQVLTQGIHCLRHAELGELEIFLVPIHSLGEQQQYEAVFN